jgi:hypothetical protein
VSQLFQLPATERVTLIGHSDVGQWRLEFGGIAPAILSAAVDLLQGTRRAQAIVADRTQTTATVEPIAVVDFYPEGDSHAQR